MPRLTDITYLATHQELRSVWLEDPTRFAILNAREQWALHGYFVPEHDLTDETLLVYRREVTKVDPSLPQRAGRAYTQWQMKKTPLAEYRKQSHVPVPGKKRTREYEVTVLSLVQPEIDAQRFTRAILAAFEDHREATSGRRPRK